MTFLLDTNVLLQPHDPAPDLPDRHDDDSWLTVIRRTYADRVLPVGIEVAERWGLRDALHPVPTADGLIAATAEAHGLTLITRNVKGFAHAGVRLLNPFTN